MKKVQLCFNHEHNFNLLSPIYSKFVPYIDEFSGSCIQCLLDFQPPNQISDAIIFTVVHCKTVDA